MKYGRLANISAHMQTPPAAYGNLPGSAKAENSCTGSWSDDRVDLLKKLWRDGLSASQIASRLRGVTRNAVIGKVHRLGLTGREAPYKPGKPLGPKAAKAPRRPPPPKAPPRPPRVVIPLHVEPTVATAKPWLERTSLECTWIVAGSGADALCCAEPIHGRGWCIAHFKRGTQPSAPSKRASEPFQARAQARFA